MSKKNKKKADEERVLKETLSWELKSILDDEKMDLLKIRMDRKVAKDIKTINMNGRIFAEVPEYGW